MNHQKSQKTPTSLGYKATMLVLDVTYRYRKRHFDSKKALACALKKNAKPCKVPKFACAQKTQIANTLCYQLGQGQRCVLYYHGGCYTRPPNHFHWKFLRKLAKQGVTVIAPIYPRAPQATASQVVPQMTEVYNCVIQRFGKNNLVVMGDSAGGGLSLAVCQNAQKQQLPQPSKIVMLSPWLDVDMQSDYQQYLPCDKMLLPEELATFGRAYRGDLPICHPFASPLFGNLCGLAPMDIFVGEGEIFMPDCLCLKQKADMQKAQLNLHTYPKMQHVFVVHPIPEAKKAQKQIFQVIK